MGITFLLVVQFGQIRMFLKANTIYFSILYMLCIGGPSRDSKFRYSTRYIAMALEMKSGPTLFQKQSLREALIVYMTTMMSKIVQNSRTGIFWLFSCHLWPNITATQWL